MGMKSMKKLMLHDRLIEIGLWLTQINLGNQVIAIVDLFSKPSLTLFLNVASQIWLLGRLLPLMVGEHVPENEPHWLCFINLLRILTIATAFEITKDNVLLH